MVADGTHDQVLIKMVLDMNIFSYRKTGQKKMFTNEAIVLCTSISYVV